MADEQRHTVEELLEQVQTLRLDCYHKDKAIERLETQIEVLDDELEALEATLRNMEDESALTSAQTLVDALRDKDERAKTLVMNAIDTGITSDLWQVL